MVDNTWLEQYRNELHSLRVAGDVRAIRKKNMELNNRLEYVKDETEKEIFLTALYETEDVLRECRTEEKLRNGLSEYREEGGKAVSEERVTEASEKERLPIRERFELECRRAEENNPEAFLWLADFYGSQGDGNKKQRNELLKMAMDAGSQEAMLRLAKVYCEGDGWEKNPGKAHAYYDKLERTGNKEAAKGNCLLYFEEERYDRVYPYVKEMIEKGDNFDPEKDWTDASLLVVYTWRGIHYGDLQSDLENLTGMHR